MLADVFLLREWMPFSDQEISIFQHYFMDYFLENERKLSKKDVYKSACLANETQYQIRLLRARISGDKNIDEVSNNRFISDFFREAQVCETRSPFVFSKWVVHINVKLIF